MSPCPFTPLPLAFPPLYEKGWKLFRVVGSPHNSVLKDVLYQPPRPLSPIKMGLPHTECVPLPLFVGFLCPHQAC